MNSRTARKRKTNRPSEGQLLNRLRTRQLFIEKLESRRVFAGVPSVAINAPTQVMIGEPLHVQVAFDNTHPSDPGYGPFVDVYLPRNGADGVSGVGIDGLSFVAGSANYLGASITTTVLVFPDLGGGVGTVVHPYAVDTNNNPIIVSGTAGDQLVVFQLPFGSFTSSQPAASIDFDLQLSSLADLATPLNIRARGGFQFGGTPLNDPATDPTILSQPNNAPAWTPIAPVTPTIATLRKTYLGPEDETATGPNFPRQYRIDVDIANGQTINSADVIDLLPNNIQLLSVNTIAPANGSVTNFPTTPANAPNNQLIVTFPTLVGTAATTDASVLFTYFVPFRDANANQIISPITGNDATAPNNASFVGDWSPIDSRDPAGIDNVVVDVAGPEHTLIPKSIATQKSVALVNDVGSAGYSAGDTVEYTILFQVSDYFAFDNLNINDIISDGQRFDTTFNPTLSVTEHGAVSSGAMAPANITTTDHFTGGAPAVAPISGTQEIDFAISDELVARGLDAILLGGLIPSAGTAGADPNPTTFNQNATTGTLRFRAIVQDNFTDDFPSGDQSVDEGDLLTNDVTIDGRVLRYTDLVPQQTESDLSAANFSIVEGTLTKAIYAINGSTVLPTPLRIAPGDTITYRLQLSIPSSDVEDLRLDDYLPLPVLLANEVTTFSDVLSAAIPAAGTAKFGPNDTFRAIYGSAPSLSTDTVSNRVSFDYGDFNQNPSVSSNIDILFTVTATSTPFADGLFLTNQVRRSQASTNAGSFTEDAIVQIQLGEPSLQIKKGIVSTSNPVDDTFAPVAVGPVSFTAPGSAGFRGSSTINSSNLLAAPINSDVSGVDAGDVVTFAIVVENTGSSRQGAFDVRLRDAMPAGFAIPSSGLNLNISDGTGTAVSFTTLGTGLFDAAGGISIDDPGATPASGNGADGGALDQYDPTNGHNILVVTYDLVLQSSVTPLQTLTNTATLFNYASVEGGVDFTTEDPTDKASVQVAQPAATKSIVSTNQSFTAGANVAIGEIVEYQSVLTIPEGATPNLVWTDAPDSGLAIIDILSLTASSSDLIASAGTFASILAGATIPASGASASLNFGTITNSNVDNSVDETITIVYRAVVINNATNNRSTVLHNQASLTYTGGSRNIVGPGVTIVEPAIAITKTIAPATGQGSENFTVTIDVAHTGASNADAFNLNLSDVLPAGFIYVGSAPTSSGLAPTTLSESSGTITATWDSFPLASVSQIRFTVQTLPTLIPGTVVTNVANQSWTSLPGDVTTAQSTNPLSTERTGNTSNPGGTANDYRSSSSDSVTIVSPGVTKTLFATNQAHTLNANVAIGEIATYEVIINVPQSSMPSAQFVDTPASGLAIVDVLSVTGSSSVTTSVGTFDDVRSNAVIAANGTSLTFAFGNLNNSDTNTATTESIVIRYRAVVLNSPNNNRGDVIDNSGLLTWGSTGSVAVDGPDLTIVEPTLAIQTAIIPTTAQANDVVEVILTIAHATGSNATAMDVSLSDVLPAGLLYDSGLTNSAGLAPASLSQAAGTISATWPTFGTSSTSEIRFFARLSPSVTAGQVITDPASVQWTSLPGNVTAPQSSHAVSTERTGSTSNPGGAVNDHLASSNDSISIVTPTAIKSLVSTNQVHTTGANVAIGEIVTYDVTLTIPQGITPSTVFTDTPDAGLAFVDIVSIVGSSQISSNLGTLASIGSTAVIPADGSSATISFGNLTNADTNSATPETITIRYRAVVLNTLTNDRGDVLNNHFTLNWGSSGSTSGDGPDLTIVEPDLSIVVSDGTPSPVDAGDTVTFTIDIAHTGTSTADAFNVDLQNLINSAANHLQYLAGSLTVSNVGGATSGTNSVAGGDLNLVWASFPIGATSRVTFSAVVKNSAPASTVLTDAGTLQWTSLPGDVTIAQASNSLSVERTGNTSNVGAVANDYSTNDIGTVTTSPPTSGKSIVTTSMPQTGTSQFNATRTDLAIGELVTYSINVVLPEGTNTLTITDQLPFAPGVLEYVSARVNAVGSQLTLSAPTIVASDTNVDGFSDRAIFSFGSVINSPDGVSNSSDVVEVYIVARVVDVPGNSNSTVLINNATINVSGVSNVVSAEVEIVEPQLLIDKVASVATARPGDTVPFTVAIQHAPSSTASAFDIAIADLLADPNLDLVPGTVTTNRGSITSGNGLADTTIGINLAELSLGQTILIGFSARIHPSTAAAVAVQNTSSLTYDSQPGPGGRVKTNADTENVTTLTPLVDLRLRKTINQSPTVINTPLQYTIVVTNNGPSTATNVALTDNLPSGLSNISASTTRGTVSIAYPTITGNLGSLLPGQSATIIVNVTSPSVAATILNLASVTSPETDSDPSNNNGSVSTVVLDVSSIAGRSWVDTDRDGVVDAGEVLLPGVLITLTGVNDLGASVTRTTTTDTTGSYRFTLLRPGTYRIHQTQPSLFIDSNEFIGSVGGTRPANDSIDIVLAAGINATNYFFTELGLRSNLLSKRSLLNSQLRLGNPVTFDAFYSILGARGLADLDGDGDVDSADFSLFQNRLGGQFNI